MKVKLVRSKMKKMIEASGNKTVNISRGMYRQLLAEKVIEEAKELAEAIMNKDRKETLNELCDLLTVQEAVCSIDNIDPDDIVFTVSTKTEKRGNFISNLGIILEE